MTPDRKVNLANLERVIKLGCADAARDHGFHNFELTVSVHDIAGSPTISVDVFILTPEQLAEIEAIREAERRKRESGN